LLTPRKYKCMFTSLHNHTYYSFLDGISKPKNIAKRCVQLGYDAISMSDHGNISCAVEFIEAMTSVCVCGEQEIEHPGKGKCRVRNSTCQKYENYKLKPIIGNEIYICQDDPTVKNKENRPLSHLVVLAKNLKGYEQLVKLTSYTHRKENKYYSPRTNLEGLRQFADGNLLAFSGHCGSELANIIFSDYKAAYNATTLDEAKTFLHPERRRLLSDRIEEYIDIFGKENFSLEKQVLEPKLMPAQKIIAEAMEWAGKKHKLKVIATGDSHYVNKEDANDQRVVLCTNLKTTMRNVSNAIANGEDVLLSGFFKSHKYGIQTIEDLLIHHTEEEIQNAYEVGQMCDSYDIRHEPRMPKFPTPEGFTDDEYMKHLCREGWKKKISGKVPKEEYPAYNERVKKELEVFLPARLSPYFLVTQDFVNWARANDIFVGKGRGSGAGCETSYLMGITGIDSHKYGLLFERFYNAGRNTPGKAASLPDIDTDFEIGKRHLVIDYLKQKYGEAYVCQVCTFNSMKGRGSLKDVLRAWDIPFDVVNRITENMPDEAKLAEELQEMKDSGEDPSIIRYCLENDPKSYEEFVIMKDDGTLEGEYARYFEQAIRLENVKRNISKHAAAIIISPEPVENLYPMYYDEGSDSYLACEEYTKLEAKGAVKYDILGVAALDKLHGIQKMLRYGWINEQDEL
jgi:DNA polymerase III subunit alpha